MEIFAFKRAGILNPTEECIEDYNSIKEGPILKCVITEPRNVGYHRKYFAFLSSFFNMLDGYTTKDNLRYELTMQSGFYYEFETTTGKKMRRPQSIAFNKMDQQEFEKFVNKTIETALVMLWKNAKKNKVNLSVEQLKDYEEILIRFF